jgi:hypothetical protein
LIKSRQTELLTQIKRADAHLDQPRAGPFGPPLFWTGVFAHSKTQKPLGCCFASAFVPVSDEKRDGGRAFSSNYRRKSRLRFAASGPHSPPRWSDARAPMRSVPALCKVRATSGTCLAESISRPLGLNPRHLRPVWSPHDDASIENRETRRPAQPSYNSKKRGWGQRNGNYILHSRR